MTIKAIDISAWQGVVSVETFQKMRDKIPFIVIRTSYTTQKGFNLRTDKVFKQNIKNAYKAGIKIGGYHYSQAISRGEGGEEAKYAVKILSPFKQYITLPIAFDWEFGGRLSAYVAKKLGKEECGKICDAFGNVVKKAGYNCMVYANLSTLNAYLPSNLYKRWPIWVAQYNDRCNYKHKHIMWQYTSGGKVSGIPGRVDMNVWYGYEPKPEPVDTYHGTLPKLPHRGWFSSGDKGEEVKKLQRFLNWYGGYGLEVDGVVGRKTINAVKQYQGRERPYLVVDGAFGPECLARARIVRR